MMRSIAFTFHAGACVRLPALIKETGIRSHSALLQKNVLFVTERNFRGAVCCDRHERRFCLSVIIIRKQLNYLLPEGKCQAGDLHTLFKKF
jgi:hypothetical protein